ncbi:MAG: asparaginase [Clostridiaceae bacterium]
MSNLTKEFRGGLLENIHPGRICIVGEDKTITHHVGEINTLTYYRSSSKPLQVLPVIENHIDEKYNLNENEVAIMAGSHAGEAIHLETILSILDKTGYSENDLIMQPTYPAVAALHDEMIRKNLPPRKALHNCSGKHIGAMLLSEYLTGDHKNYWQPDSAAQKRIRETIAYLSEYPIDQIQIGIDGCGVPVFAVPLKNIALSYLKLACPDQIDHSDTRNAVIRITDLMHKNPVMVRGTGYLCSIMNEDPNIVSKGGAKGVYAFGLVKERLGVAIKIKDGTEEPWPVVIAEILRQLNYDNLDTIHKLEALCPSEILNDNGVVVGKIETCFKL